MNAIRTIVFLIFIVFSSCNIANEAIDRALYPPKKPNYFEYYNKEFKFPEKTELKIDDFYITEGVGASGHYYDYLKFFEDGMVYHFGGTGIAPQEMFKKKYMDVIRKKNGAPSYRKDSWGYFKFSGDILIFTMVDYTAFSTDKYKYVGNIERDTLKFAIFHQDYETKEYEYTHTETYVHYSTK